MNYKTVPKLKLLAFSQFLCSIDGAVGTIEGNSLSYENNRRDTIYRVLNCLHSDLF